jgi:hypothetical protein
VSILLPTREVNTVAQQHDNSSSDIDKTPIISRFEIESEASLNKQSVSNNESFLKKTLPDTDTTTIQQTSSRSLITRITSEGRIISSNYQLPVQHASQEPVILRAQTENHISTGTVESTTITVGASRQSRVKFNIN